jgi:YD repeat-containing protein
MKPLQSIVILFTLSFCLQLHAQVTVTYTYDNLQRLTQASYSNGVNIMYSYDALGNRIKETTTKTLVLVNLKLNLEGFYDASTHEMRPVLLNQGTSSDATLVDDITIELIDPTTLNTAATVVAPLKTNGTAVCNFPSVPDGNYYVVIKHRNTIQTWSAAPVSISASPVIYDFSDAATKAYGSNLVELEPGVYGLYSGDLNQDGNIDNSDYTLWENDSNAFLFGFYATDLNGDGNVDNSDYTIWEANSNNFIYSIRPNLD